MSFQTIDRQPVPLVVVAGDGVTDPALFDILIYAAALPGYVTESEGGAELQHVNGSAVPAHLAGDFIVRVLERQCAVGAACDLGMARFVVGRAQSRRLICRQTGEGATSSAGRAVVVRVHEVGEAPEAVSESEVNWPVRLSSEARAHFEQVRSWWAPSNRRRLLSSARGMYDIVSPYFDSKESGLPGWVFALPATVETPTTLSVMAHTACARLNVSAREANAAAARFVRTGGEDPESLALLVEVLMGACVVAASMCAYLNDASPSGKSIERYSLSARMSGTGDCEDLAKLIQSAGVAFSLADGDPRNGPLVRALSNIADEYLFGMMTVAARGAGSGGKFTRGAGASGWEDIKAMVYNDFLSHMVAVAIPKRDALARLPKDTRVQGARTAGRVRAPLPTCVLEGTSLRSPLCGTSMHTRSLARMRCAPAPSWAQTLDATQDGFYVLATQVMFGSTAQIECADTNGRLVRSNEFCITRKAPGSEDRTYGVRVADITANLPGWELRNTNLDTGYTPDSDAQVRAAGLQYGLMPVVPYAAPSAAQRQEVIRDVAQYLGAPCTTAEDPLQNGDYSFVGAVYRERACGADCPDKARAQFRSGELTWRLQMLSCRLWSVEVFKRTNR